MENKKKKPGKGIIFTDLIYIKGVKERLDRHGRKFQTCYFIIGQDMGFMSCSYYGDIELKDGMCLKLLQGRFCPNKTQQNVTYMNFRIEKFEIWQPPQQQMQTMEFGDIVTEVPVDGKIVNDSPKEEISDELNWINEPNEQEKPKDDGDTLVDINEVTF